MRFMRAIFVCLVLAPSQANAQEVQLTSEQIEELRWWVGEMQRWQEWVKKYDNKALNFRQGLVKIFYAPDVPEWLEQTCWYVRLDEAEDNLRLACEILKETGNKTAVELQEALDRAREEDTDFRTWLLRHLHYDFAYTDTQYRSFRSHKERVVRSFGLFGMHLSAFDLGRIQIQALPGFMIARNDIGKWRLHYTWGFSVRVLEFRQPGAKNMVQMHLNLIKAFSHHRNGSMDGIYTGRNMGGVSFTLK